MNAITHERVGEGVAVSMFAASLGFSIGWVGPAGVVLFPVILPAMVLVAGPGAAVAGFVLLLVMQNRARIAASHAELRWCGVLVGLPLGLLSVLPALLLWNQWFGERSQLSLQDLPLAYVMGGLSGGMGLGYGVTHGLEPEGTP